MVFAPSSLILTNYFLPVNWALAFNMKYVSLLTILIILNGCASKSPNADVNFCKIQNISELHGEYHNKSDDRLGGVEVYLSQMIWPEFNILTLKEHKEIDKISISTTSTGKVQVNAFSNNNLIKSSKPEHLQQIVNGIIPLNNNNSVLPHLGTIVGVNSTELFIFQDCSNNIVLGKNSTQTGLGYLIIPITLSNSYTVTFLRVFQANKSLKQDKKQLVFARASLILTNYF